MESSDSQPTIITIITHITELNHDITKHSKSHPHPDVFTTDSGIVTTTPRNHRGSVYDVEEAKLSNAQVINYVQHDNVD